MPIKTSNKIFVVLAALSWISLLALNLYTIYASSNNIPFYISDPLINLLLSLFFCFVFLYFKIELAKKRSSNFIELLWQVFIIGSSTILVSLFIKFFLFLIDQSELAENIILVNFLYHLNIGLITIFLGNAFYVWKKMILYQKSRLTNISWYIFEYLVYASILLNFFYFDITDWRFYIYTSPLTILGLMLSFNVKWVAFLNYKQKWQSILLIVLVILISSTFLQEIIERHITSSLIIDLADNIFIIAVFAFILLNCFTSLLVLLFHLPTSSVFEQKFGEVMIFQKLNQSIQMGEKEEEVYEILIESSVNTVMADAAWLEIVNEKGNFKAFINKNINEIDIFEIKKVLRKNSININNEPHYIKNIKNYNYSERIKDLSFKSILIVPLFSNDQLLGTMVLLKNLNDGFDKEMVDIIFTFVSQASLAIKNFRLISEAIENERYKEELKIAKEVQRSLFPESLIFNIHVEMSAFSKAADEVGGDYYDVYEYSNEKLAVVIGDVSGNGTSAAFNMAQMKGVFQSLIQLDIPSDQFMNYANKALSRCLEKRSFITLSLFLVDIAKKTFQFARAGHCPPLYFNNATKETYYLQSKGLGLGIIRNKDYSKHIEKIDCSYSSGDVMILFTDGIVEACNESNEEFGFERLKNLLFLNSHLNTKQISDKIVEDLYAFTGTKNLNDDYTFLVIKFI
ncbi:MAG TPA: GAF domain-containing SpoIIE family protein phosphatase [Cytophagaceae bacterium]